ncbi:MAG: M81 family metallopeptidase [Planctomycetota bacterium]|jgi:microcystin degradation protein MlrC
MRIAIGGISHETSSFAPGRTTIADFESGFGLYRGQEVTDRFRGSNTCTGGFLDGSDEHGFEAVPLLWGFAYPSGLIVRDEYETLKSDLLQRLADADTDSGPVDGVLLDLHGAMVVEGLDDGDGDLVMAVREVIGPDRPLITTYDLHGNHTVDRVEAADAIIGFDTFPHIDMAERGREAATMIVRTLRGEIHPVGAIHQLPMFWGTRRQVTAHPPMNDVMRRVHAIEERPGILSVTLATGFPWADVPDVGTSVTVIADGDRALAQNTADEFAAWLWENRQQWYSPPMTIRDALAAGDAEGQYPVIIADHADNTGGGSPGDSTEVLKTFLGLNLQDALLLYLVDAVAAQRAHEAGVGSTIDFSLGGHSDPAQGEPIDCTAEVMAISDGAFTYDGPMWAGLTGNMGTSAWLRIGGVHVVVVTAREQPVCPAFARSLGIDCAAMTYICVKSAAHFRAAFEPIAGSIFNVDAAAIHTHDFSQLKYTRRTRPVFPVELD